MCIYVDVFACKKNEEHQAITLCTEETYKTLQTTLSLYTDVCTSVCIYSCMFQLCSVLLKRTLIADGFMMERSNMIMTRATSECHRAQRMKGNATCARTRIAGKKGGIGGLLYFCFCFPYFYDLVFALFFMFFIVFSFYWRIFMTSFEDKWCARNEFYIEMREHNANKKKHVNLCTPFERNR